MAKRFVDSALWSSSEFGELGGNAKLLFLYLITSEITHVSSLMKFDVRSLNKRLFQDEDDCLSLKGAVDELSRSGEVIIDYINGIAFVPSFLDSNGYHRSDGNVKAILGAISSHRNSPLTPLLVYKVKTEGSSRMVSEVARFEADFRPFIESKGWNETFAKIEKASSLKAYISHEVVPRYRDLLPPDKDTITM